MQPERLDKDALDRLVQELLPGGRLLRARRFRGGLGSLMHLLTIETSSGKRISAVLRRYLVEWPNSTPEAAATEFRLLQVLQTAGIPAPKPLLLDANGRYFAAPTLVLSYVPGRSFMAPASRPEASSQVLERWTDEMARALVQINAITPETHDLSWLPSPDVTGPDGLPWFAHAEMEGRKAQVETMEPLAQEAYHALLSRAARVEEIQPCLVHSDFWPGNTVFSRGRLAAVIDWSGAHLGDRRSDVSQCRADLVVSHGLELADAFQQAYERHDTRPMPDMAFFDLMLGLRALVYYEHWLKGYHDAGQTHLKPEAVGERLRAFLRRALASV
jgi:aminoglycoside phosphotransferase (APT) family kinase protein